jgi:hypothetical protein
MAPGGFQATPGDGYVLLNWTPPLVDGGTRITGYSIYRGMTATSIYPFTSCNSTAIYFRDHEVLNGITYYYAIASVNVIGESGMSVLLSARPRGLPSPPTNVQAFAFDGLVSLTWGPAESDGGDPILSVMIYREEGEGGAILLDTIDPDFDAYSDGTVTNGISYRYYLSSVSAAGEGKWSPPADALPIGLPTAPRSLALNLSSGVISLRWDPPQNDGGSDIIRYIIYRSTDNGTAVVLCRVSGSVRTVTDSTASHGSDVTYWVSAANEFGEGPRSGPASVHIPGPSEGPTEWLFAIIGIVIVGLVIVGALIGIIMIRRSGPAAPSVGRAMAGPSPGPAPGGSEGPSVPQKEPDLPMDRDFVSAMLPSAIGQSTKDNHDLPPPEEQYPRPSYKEYIDHMMPSLGDGHPVLDDVMIPSAGADPVPEEGIPGSVNNSDPIL